MSRLLDVREIRKAFDRADTEVARFNATHGPLIPWNGQMVKALSEAAFQSLSDLCKLCAVPNDQVHDQAREILLALDDFARAFLDYQDRSSNLDETCHPAGTSEMWNAFFVLRRSIFEPIEFRPLESIDVLLNKQRVPIQQIAKIYGFVSGDGSPEVHKVEEELASPGTHTGGDWLPPPAAKHRAELQLRWSKRTPISDFLDPDETGDRGGPKASAPESLETLIQQRVPVAQIMKMKPQLGREEIEQAAADMGITLPDAKYHRPDPAAAEQAETGVSRGNALKASGAKQAKAAAAVVRQLKGEGLAAEEITARVGAQFPGVDVSSIVG